ncbi:MAG: DUF4252 domain-containing protein [Saprospiraceae bacterium]|nr:DUF4252 domain-containing protein [Saprospiraceae bacterium]MCB9318626.1 DUF4252 domain-containing protein [Lewinellaceae bacterium]
MKKFILLNLTFLSLLFVTQSKAQSAVDEFISYYKGYDNALQLSFPGFIARIGIDIAAKEEPSLASLSNRISSLRFLILDQHVDGLNSDLRFLKKDLNREGFETLFMVRDDGDEVHLFLKEDPKHRDQLILLIQGGDEDNLLLFQLKGRFNQDDLNNLKDHMVVSAR